MAQTLLSVHASLRFHTGTGKSACATKFNYCPRRLRNCTDCLLRIAGFCFVDLLLAGSFRFVSQIFLPLLTHPAASCPIFHLDSVHVLKDFKIQLSLDLNGECLEPILCLRRERSSLLQVGTISNDRRERGTHLSQHVEYFKEEDINGWYTSTRLTDKGIGWLLANQDRFRIRRNEDTREAAQSAEITDEDIPF